MRNRGEATMDNSIVDKVVAYDKNGYIKKEIDNALGALKVFRTKFPFTENPKSIENLKPDDIFKVELR